MSNAVHINLNGSSYILRKDQRVGIRESIQFYARVWSVNKILHVICKNIRRHF